ncbi:site-2 protease family protein [Arenibacter lacus]|uniref:site-2 protease family protein n=1 Tax=Arenibacter lacus TaxID=2608629 RepID=UPI00123E2FEC|nr:site-2 protease family protein [Arenibacter lacus]
MKGVLNLGRVAGIKIEVHWTFSLLLIWVALIEVKAGADLTRILLNELLILLLFGCVVLHELGHALTAKKFNIETKKIMLLPIGGVASLEKMPEKPGQELLVALAGPAVNVVIAFLLALTVPFKYYFGLNATEMTEVLYTPSLQNFIFYLFIANVMLVLFNLIPAFPMDGGRVLRALLSYRLGRVEATRIAAGIGQTLAVVFSLLGLFYNPFLILIAFFIFFGAYAENQMVKRTSLIKGHIAKEATLTNITILSPVHSVQEVVDLLLAGTEKDFVVMDQDEIVGIVAHKDIVKHARTPSLLVKEIMGKNFTTVDATTSLTQVYEMINREKNGFFPVVEDKKLIGAIDQVNLSEFILLKSATIP